MKPGAGEKKILEQLQESEELYKTLVRNLVYPIIIHIDGRVVFANEMVLEFAGLTPEEVTGKDLAEIFTDPQDPENAENLYRLFVDPNVSEEEIDIRTTSGKILIHTFLLRNNRIRYRGREAVMSILFDITDRKKLERYIVDKVMETEEKDRKRFAADLHDDLGPTLSTIKLHLGMLKEQSGKDTFNDTISLCTGLLNEAIAKMRIISNNLMPRLIEDYGLEAALNSLILSVQQEGRFTIEFRSDLGPHRFPKTIELHLYRIISELINNTLRHSGATESSLRLSLAGNTLKMIYSDNGKGYDPGSIDKQKSGMGIANIINRVDVINGTIRFVKKNGRTEVRLIVHCYPA